MNKKLLAIFLICVLSFSLISCGQHTTNVKPTIVCVEYFTYDWVRNILGDDIEEYDLVLLNQSGKDMHSFEPSANDMVQILDSDFFIYLGGISEKWIDDFLLDKDIISTSLLENFLNMNVSNDYNLDLSDIDEHFYLSPKIAYNLILDLGTKFESRFDNSKYFTNAEKYASEIKKLEDIEIGDNPIVVCDRYPFEYLSDDFGFSYYAAFDGCSAEAEASFSIILELSDAINKYDLDRVYIIENSDAAIAEQVIATSGRNDIKIIELNSLQSVTDMNTSYLDVLTNDINLIIDGTFKS